MSLRGRAHSTDVGVLDDSDPIYHDINDSGHPGNVWVRPLLLLPQTPSVRPRAELICGSSELVCIRHPEPVP